MRGNMLNEPQIIRAKYLVIMRQAGVPDHKIEMRGSLAPLSMLPCKTCGKEAHIAHFEGQRIDDERNVLGHSTIFCGTDGCSHFEAYMLPDAYNKGRATLDNWITSLWNAENDPDGTHECDFLRFGGEITPHIAATDPAEPDNTATAEGE